VAVRLPNPYRPGFNQAPVVLAGRSEVLDGAREALAVAGEDGRTPRPLVLLGPRGVGKTVTLGEIAEIAAAERSWPAVHVEAKGAGGLLADLARRLDRARAMLDGEAPAGPAPRTSTRRARVSKVSAQVVGIGGEVEFSSEGPQRSVDGTGALADAFEQVMAVAIARDAGLVLTLDELQVAKPAEVAALAGLLQENVPRDWPLVVAIAALPTLRTARGKRRLPTYLERSEWHELGALDLPDAREALAGPAAQAGRPMSAAAVDVLLELAGGYPYAIQVAGHFAWRASSSASQITVTHARAAVPRIESDLAQLFRSRWDDASPREREYLAALARLTEADAGARPPNGGQVAAALAQAPTSVSYLRDRLLKKGTLYADSAGGLHFIAPGMAEWIRGSAP
jgi:hypothetical protein